MRTISCAAPLALSVVLSLSAACRLYNLERKLDPVNEDFLSKVRYIITSEERGTFLLLPDAEKPRFIEDFWKRRDPDPETEENEFKTEYFSRIERATKLFIGEGLPGWLTDRGRIYVLFGPPMERLTQPVGGDATTRCQEVWYYGNFPVVFADPNCSGSYKLVTYDLSMLSDINLIYMHELNRAQANAQSVPKIEEHRVLDELRARLDITIREAARIVGIVVIEIPYGEIWYTSYGKKLRTTFHVALELSDENKAVVWKHEQDFEVALQEGELEKKSGQLFSMEIPVLIRDADTIARLAPGQSKLQISLVNKTGDEMLSKTLDFK
jgi:GWxTD domain-containing protein